MIWVLGGLGYVGNDYTWTLNVCKLMAKKLLETAKKAVILHTFGVQVWFGLSTPLFNGPGPLGPGSLRKPGHSTGRSS